MKVGLLAFERGDGRAIDRGRACEFDEPGSGRFAFENRYRLFGLRVRHDRREKEARSDNDNSAHDDLAGENR